MAIDNGLKRKRGGFVVSSDEKFQQLRVTHRTVGTQPEQPVKIPTDSGLPRSHHPSLTSIGPMGLFRMYCPPTGVRSRQFDFFSITRNTASALMQHA
jgi:hypothetical protein